VWKVYHGLRTVYKLSSKLYYPVFVAAYGYWHCVCDALQVAWLSSVHVSVFWQDLLNCTAFWNHYYCNCNIYG